MLTILENCRISPPPATVGDRSLPLTFFDASWLLFFPSHQVFFFEFPHSKQHFMETIVPNAKHSLSITLQHFFPFASNLIVYPNSNRSNNFKKPEIRHVEGDSVALTFAESNLDFDDLTGNHLRRCNKFYELIPVLGSASKGFDYVKIPLFSVQVTLFKNSGISIGITNNHSLCDASTKFDFLKAWASIAKHGTDEFFLVNESLPLYDRVIQYPDSLDEIYFNQSGMEAIDVGFEPPRLVSDTDKVRATVVLTQTHIARLKKWLQTQVPKLEYVSSFSVSCGFVWSCIVKSRVRIGEQMNENDVERFLCAINWRSRIDYLHIPQSYFGNCVGPCITTPTKCSLLAAGDKGFLTAAQVFGKALNETVRSNDDPIKDAFTWLEKAYEPVPTTGVAGSPKIKIYDLDFGWGKLKKYEIPSVDYNGSISVNASKESPGGIEIGLSRPAKQMDAFISICQEELESTFYDLE